MKTFVAKIDIRRLKGKHYFFFLVIFLAAGILFLPLPWSFALPGEVRYEFQERLIAQEHGFIAKTPGENSNVFRKGEVVFELHDPFLVFAGERLEHMLRYDRILFNQQSASRSTIGDSMLTGRKISSDLHAAGEIRRKIISGKKTASRDLLFIPSIGKEDQGYFVRSGRELGKLCSEKKIVRAYADDQEIRKIQMGQKVNLFVKDRLRPVTGRVMNIHPIPVLLYDSPALQSLGGEIPADAADENDGRTKSVHPVYCVDIYSEIELPWQNGRFVRIKVSSSSVLAGKIWRLFVSALRRDLF